MLKCLIAAAMLFVTPVLAQDAVPAAEGVVVIPASDITERLGAAPARPGAAVSSNVTVTDRYIALFSHRTADGTPEQHAKWTDVMVMLQGEVTLTYGGTLSGNTVDANGESHAGAIAGGTTVVLHAGDYLRVPAGVPHMMTAPKGDFRYFVTKVHI
jgi:mannose-6-phosphate isomerase-like protein (cupin superfamily)